jgi:prepilin signal peptidase PulO-like enzyme (type II secretory pathway)
MFYLLGFVLGLAIGSFINCLVYRFYQKKTILGRSMCSQCGHQIGWYDNIPLLSFIVLRGRCRHCQQKISYQYPVVELATGLLFLGTVIHLQSPIPNPQSLIPVARDWLMLFALIFIFVYDLKYYLIEDAVILPVAAIVFILNLFLKISVLSLLLAAGLSAVFFLAQYFLTRGKGIGFGDFRIGILMGVYFGWPKIIIAIFSAYIIGIIVSLFLLALKKKGLKSQVPLGPFLTAGSLLDRKSVV